jgi:hypothetical protein
MSCGGFLMFLIYMMFMLMFLNGVNEFIMHGYKFNGTTYKSNSVFTYPKLFRISLGAQRTPNMVSDFLNSLMDAKFDPVSCLMGVVGHLYR